MRVLARLQANGRIESQRRMASGWLREPLIGSASIGRVTESGGRLYVLDLPGGSARALAIMITAPEAAFELALDAAAPVLDSFEFHAG